MLVSVNGIVGPEVAVASVCLIAVLYNYEQWRGQKGGRRGCEMQPTSEMETHAKRNSERGKIEDEGGNERGTTNVVRSFVLRRLRGRVRYAAACT